MTSALTTEQIECYQRDGYLFPLNVLGEKDTAQYRAQLQEIEDKNGSALREAPHLVMPFVDTLIRHPAITESVASIIGDDLLVWGSGFFIKDPGTADFVGWHQDLHYWGLDDEDEVTAWLALSPATVESGCMRFIPGSHRQSVEHIDHNDPDAMLSRGQQIAVRVNEDDAINVTLQAGQISLHHGRTLHASLPNRSPHQRIGLAIRYISPKMKQSTGEKTIATLVRGQDQYRHFELFPGPKCLMDEADMATRQRAISLANRINYRGAAASIAARA